MVTNCFKSGVFSQTTNLSLGQLIGIMGTEVTLLKSNSG